MVKRPKFDIGNHQNPTEENRQQPLWPRLQQLLTWHASGDKRNKYKNELLGSSQDKKTSAQGGKQLTKLKHSLQNGRRYLQVTYQTKV